MTGAIEEIAAHPLMPVVVLRDEADADPLLEALFGGGVRSVEITLRTPAGIAAIRRAARVDGLLVGAGTVRTRDQLSAAVDAGAQFIVAPGLDEAVVESALAMGVIPIPGVATPTEVQRAANLGLTHVKVFPARELGGPAFIEALAGPFPEMHFLPSGGVGAHNARSYLDLEAVFAISGSWFVPDPSIANHDVGTMRRLAREAANLAGLP